MNGDGIPTVRLGTSALPEIPVGEFCVHSPQVGSRYLVEWEFAGAPDVLTSFRVGEIDSSFRDSFEQRPCVTQESADLFDDFVIISPFVPIPVLRRRVRNVVLVGARCLDVCDVITASVQMRGLGFWRVNRIFWILDPGIRTPKEASAALGLTGVTASGIGEVAEDIGGAVSDVGVGIAGVGAGLSQAAQRPVTTLALLAVLVVGTIVLTRF